MTLTPSSGRVLYILYTVPWIVTCWPQAFPQARNDNDKIRTSNALWVEWAKGDLLKVILLPNPDIILPGRRV